ncbi:MAG: HlyC/CorC family transporter [Anaerolineales bacterium]|nr:HlyC/CorC family transporter [Anaerolineales bacterium]MCB0005214.1 HlyC/CorC family transporter [Anaerolineales bacterium]MCB0010533.1 HlyC/CorC family transporter [Anaerolineales bacterium]MCB8961110.1 HlyC/CorC family transporter [Ardenticatenales bacterium]
MALVIFSVVTLLILFNAFYVAAEFATVAARRTRISQMAASGNGLAQKLLPILEDSHALDNYIAACQVGITISSLVAGAYGQNVIATALAPSFGEMLGGSESLLARIGVSADLAAEATALAVAIVVVLTVLTILQVVIGELLPKSVAVQFPEQVALWVVVPMIWSARLFKPLIWIFNGSGRAILRAMGYDGDTGHDQVYSPEEIEILVQGSHEGGLLDEGERQMLRNAFRLRDLTARQVMVHRTKLVLAATDISIAEAIKISLESGFTRLPVYEGKLDDIKGFVHIKDLFRLHMQQSGALADIIRPVVHVPETMPVADVWETLNKKRQYVAVVFDEYGGTAGLITMEDLVEEIFGELQDEFDDESALLALDKEGRLYLRGDLLIADINEYLDLSLPEEAADTLSGLIFSELGRAPKPGDEIDITGTVFRVEAMADLGVAEVSLELPSREMLDLSEWGVSRRE